MRAKGAPGESMLKNTAEVNIGRLVELRAEAGYRTPAEVDGTFAQIDDAIAKLPATAQIVTIVDARRCSVMSPEAATHMVRRVMALQPRTLRSAVLASQDAPSAILQFGRMIRDVDNPSRKLCFDAADAITWLNDVLILEERARLRWFLERR